MGAEIFLWWEVFVDLGARRTCGMDMRSFGVCVWWFCCMELNGRMMQDSEKKKKTRTIKLITGFRSGYSYM